ncbi:ABC transporter permease subunit [Mesorhizobium sp. B2-4-6]|uniref:ABC transporter permease n=1 Tax=Mesorhizobium sp. B2-4-6 TaxID=2589943 RepID=UPI0015E3AF08|nr:ABC transporter permease subunit [Mesorhizobium sp. B2-4-6]
MIVFSFNDPGGRFNYELGSFSLAAWRAPLAVSQLPTALANSLLVAFCAALLAALLGTPLGFILGRRHFAGQGAVSVLTFIPLATPEVVLGAGFLALFVATATVPALHTLSGGLFFPLGLPSVIVAHTTLGISFVTINVRARVIVGGVVLEQAAQDLGASGFTVFRTIWLPIILPGIVSGALLVFSVSLDDFVLTNFTAGGTVLFPTWLYGLMRRELPPQIAVVGTAVFLLSLALTMLSVRLSRPPRAQ